VFKVAFWKTQILYCLAKCSYTSTVSLAVV